VAENRLVLTSPVDFDREMKCFGCSANELDGELGAELISHLHSKRPSQARKLIFFAHSAIDVRCSHVIGMSGDPPFVEHEQLACPLLFDNETDH
jgi:hypothetical protein